jgi:Skp family chaperone for outer membrane proteins
VTAKGIVRLLLVIVALASGPVGAQELGLVQSPILTIESDRLFSDSAFGKRVAREIEADSAVLAAENRRIEAELTAEEKALTERRPDMDPDGFRTLADAFDAKVQDIRRAQEAKAREIARRQDASRVTFLRVARPILETLMRDARAAVILERSSVFLSANVSDVTDLAISRIDVVLGEGTTIKPGGEE